MLIAKLELTDRIAERELRKLSRRLSTKEVNTMIRAGARIIHQGEGLCRTNLHIGYQVTIVNPKPGQQDSGSIKGTTPTGLNFVHTANRKLSGEA